MARRLESARPGQSLALARLPPGDWHRASRYAELCQAEGLAGIWLAGLLRDSLAARRTVTLSQSLSETLRVALAWQRLRVRLSPGAAAATGALRRDRASGPSPQATHWQATHAWAGPSHESPGHSRGGRRRRTLTSPRAVTVRGSGRGRLNSIHWHRYGLPVCTSHESGSDAVQVT